MILKTLECSCSEKCSCTLSVSLTLCSMFTLPAGAVAEYCDECVCLRRCLSVHEDISGTTRAVFTNFLCMLPMSVARSSDMFTIGCITYRREGVFFPLMLHIPTCRVTRHGAGIYTRYVHENSFVQLVRETSFWESLVRKSDCLGNVCKQLNCNPVIFYS